MAADEQEQRDAYKLKLGERAWKGSGLDPANRPAALTREEHDFMLERLAAGIPLSVVARALGRPISTLEKGVVVDDEGQARRNEESLAAKRAAERVRRRAERVAERALGPTTVWRSSPRR